MKRALGILAISFMAVTAVAASGQFFAFATRDSLLMGIGKYQPGKGWIEYQKFYEPSEPNEIFTLYTMGGEVAQVRNSDKLRSDPHQTPADWSAHITSWHKEGQGDPYALAVKGASPLQVDSAHPIPLNDPDMVHRVSLFLEKRKLHIPNPYLTQAYEVTLSSGGVKGVLVCAHSDAHALRDDESANVYAVALLEVYNNGAWTDYPLVQQTSFKPAGRSIDEHERLYGYQNFYRFLSCLDIDGDGWKEIVVYEAQKHFGTQIDVIGFNGHRTKRLITAFKHL